MTIQAVTFDAITLDDSADADTPDGDGIRWAWSTIPGWWEGSAPLFDVNGLPGRDGSAFGCAYDRGRAVTLNGVAWVPVGTTNPRTKMLLARRKVQATAKRSLRASVVLSVDEADQTGTGLPGVLRLLVRNNLAPTYQPQRHKNVLEFAVPLVSEDYRKTSATLTQTTVGAGGVVTNPGDAPATPSLRIAGDSAANVGVTNATTGQTVSTDLNLAGGDVLVIDCATGQATLNGADASSHLALGSAFFDLVSGANTVNLVNGGAASLRVDFRASWY